MSQQYLNGTRMNRNKNLLIVSDEGPADIFSGGLVLRHMLYQLESNFEMDLVLFSSIMKSYAFKFPEKSTVNIFEKPAERFIKINNRFISELIGLLFEVFVYKPWKRKAKSRLKKIFTSKKYDCVLLILQGQFLPRLVANFAFEGAQVIVQYWDPSEWHIQSYNLGTYQSLKLKKSLKKIDSCISKNIIVPSEGMKNSISGRTNKNKNEIFVVYPPAQTFSEATEIPFELSNITTRTNTKVFMYAGALYAKDAINIFLDALELLEYKVGTQNICMLIISDEIDGITRDSPFLFKFKRLNPDVVSKVLNLTDLALLPYPFFNEILVEQAFPSKFPTYCANCKNIFILAPENSSIMKLAREEGISAGVVATLSAISVASEISYLFSENRDLIQRKIISSISEEKFSEKVFRQQLEVIFEVKLESFTPVNYTEVKVSPVRSAVNLLNFFVRKLRLGKIKRTIRWLKLLPVRVVDNRVQSRLNKHILEVRDELL